MIATFGVKHHPGTFSAVLSEQAEQCHLTVSCTACRQTQGFGALKAANRHPAEDVRQDLDAALAQKLQPAPAQGQQQEQQSQDSQAKQGQGQAESQQAQPEPQTIQLGQTPDQVRAALGQPDKVVNLGAKQIYVYKDLKVTFVSEKVSDVQ